MIQGATSLPACSIGLSLPGVPSIVIDNRSGMRVAVDHLLKGHGRRRIAYVSGPSTREMIAPICGAATVWGGA